MSEIDNVVSLSGKRSPLPTDDDVTSEMVLDAARDLLKTVIVLGVTKDGYRYYGSSTGDAREIVYLMEQLKLELLHGRRT